MLAVSHIETWGFEHAIRGMRNPMNSWDRIDSHWEDYQTGQSKKYQVGENDLKLMKQLFDAGKDGNYAHRKYLRQIFVSMDIQAPIYWWKEFDTYKVGTVANSTSTMHKIAAKEFELDDFSYEHLRYEYSDGDGSFDEASWAEVSLLNTIETLNRARDLYLKSKDKKHWWLMIQLLPSSYNQLRTVTMNYENVFNIITQRKGHKLDEWRAFVKILYRLPYVSALLGEGVQEVEA